eukprot:scaffold9347_cov110-Isochrysis_galbana.AAC.3
MAELFVTSDGTAPAGAAPGSLAGLGLFLRLSGSFAAGRGEASGDESGASPEKAARRAMRADRTEGDAIALIEPATGF